MFFCLDTKEPKDQDFIKFQCSSTSGFCHATQAVHHKVNFSNKVLSSWFTSALLEMPHAHKTILELLLKFYNVGLQTPKSCSEAKSMSRILAISKNFLRRDWHYKNA